MIFFSVKPTLWTAWSGWYANRVHIHIDRIPISEIPTTKADLTQWIYARFHIKDRLLAHFTRHQRFPSYQENNICTNPNTQKPWHNGDILCTPTPLSVYLCTLGWLIYLTIASYLFWTSYFVRYYYYIGWGFFFVSSLSQAIKRWRGIAPPVGYLQSLKQQKQKQQ